MRARARLVRVCVCARASDRACKHSNTQARMLECTRARVRPRTALAAAKSRTVGTRTFPPQNCANSRTVGIVSHCPDYPRRPVTRSRSIRLWSETVEKSRSTQAIRASLSTGFPRRLFTSVSYCPAQKPSRSGMEQIHFRTARMLLAGGKHSANVARTVLAGGERILPSMHARTHACTRARTHARMHAHERARTHERKRARKDAT